MAPVEASSATDLTTDLTLDGVPTIVNGRHAFVHERVLALIRRETKRSGALRMSKRQLADLLGCDICSVNTAIRRLRRTGQIESIPQHDASGGQVENAYRTPADDTEEIAS